MDFTLFSLKHFGIGSLKKLPLSFLLWGHVVSEQTSPPLCSLVCPPQELSWPPGQFLALSLPQMTAQGLCCGVPELSALCSSPDPQHHPLGAVTILHLLNNGDELTGNQHSLGTFQERSSPSPLLTKLGFCRSCKMTFTKLITQRVKTSCDGSQQISVANWGERE